MPPISIDSCTVPRRHKSAAQVADTLATFILDPQFYIHSSDWSMIVMVFDQPA